MNTALANKKYIGILWAMGIACCFVAISLIMGRFLKGTAWYLFSSLLRFAFGFTILFTMKKVCGRSPIAVLSPKGSKNALIAGCGFILYFLYFVFLMCLGVKAISGLSLGFLISQLILQQIATAFYEELNFRVLILEGYFHGESSAKRKLAYAFLSFLVFGALHIVTGWSLSLFWRAGAMGFAFAVMYLKSRNILVPMILHFIYDVAANLSYYAQLNESPLFMRLNSMPIVLIMFLISLIMLLRKEKTKSQ